MVRLHTLMSLGTSTIARRLCVARSCTGIGVVRSPIINRRSAFDRRSMSRSSSHDRSRLCGTCSRHEDAGIRGVGCEVGSWQPTALAWGVGASAAEWQSHRSPSLDSRLRIHCHGHLSLAADASVAVGAPNKSVQATAAARFRFLALVVFIRFSCRSHPSPAAVPDLYRSALLAPCSNLPSNKPEQI
jgi:hypothetical protein